MGLESTIIDANLSGNPESIKQDKTKSYKKYMNYISHQRKEKVERLQE
jgi:hypothetical protein